jgi:alpha-galactosidase
MYFRKFSRVVVLGFAVLVVNAVRGQEPAPNPVAPAQAEAAPAPLPPTLTPASTAEPRIHGAKVFGVHPGHPFLFTVAATGDRPMTFSAEALPDGLKLDPATGQITGTAPAAGDYHVTLHARNALGAAQRPLLIKVGDTLALTPPMGWNSWNCFANKVSADKIQSAADAMVKSGLVNHGWTYINIDDYWQNTVDAPHTGRWAADIGGTPRNPDGTIQPNSRFPDMKGLADYIHARGLKAGLYSSPGDHTCGHCEGSLNHEQQDAQSYAGWGFDYLKYDWCSYALVYKKEDGLAGMKKPYEVMGDALAKVPRDIVYSFCQYGMGNVWEWGAQAHGNLWRTTGDINDSWKSMSKNGAKQAKLAGFAGPGHWNDPDMLVVGEVGWRKALHPTHLTPDEQYFHISLWALEAAPLLIGCDLTKLDPFTLGLLTNDEVIDVDQDPLGKAAQLITPAVPDASSTMQIWARPLEDGSMAVGLFNLGTSAAQATVNWSDLQLSGSWKVRDLWRQKDLGTFDQKFSSTVAPHGVLLVRLIKP